MKKIDLGKISIPLDEYASQGNAILGIRDSGKSYTATAIAERLMDCGIPIIAFDPIGIWRYLRVPGAGKGYEVVVAGGKQGDLPLTPRGAQEIVRAAMRENVSLIVDLYDIHLSKADWREVVASSIRTLLYENGEHGLRHIFIEEAAEFCPQVISPDQGRVYAEVEKLARMGGNALLGYTLINQRAEQVNKAVLELCDCMILHRQKGRNSINALSKWLEIASTHDSKALISSLPGLQQGECWVWPAGSDAPVRTKVPEKNSFHPDRRARQAAPKSSKAVDVSAFVTTMKGSLEALTKEAEANDPKLLRAEIVKLKKEVGHPQMDRDALVQAEQRGYERGRAESVKALEMAAAAISSSNATIAKASTELATLQLRLYGAADALPVRKPNAAPPRPQEAPQRAPAGHGKGSQDLGTGGLRRMLIALAQRPQGMNRRQLGVRAGMSSSSGTFATYLGKGRASGWMNGDASLIRITDDGVKALGTYQPLPTGPDLLAYWLGELGNSGAARLLQALATAYPGGLSRDEAATAANMSASSGTFATYLGKLRTLELINGSGELRASEELFDG